MQRGSFVIFVGLLLVAAAIFVHAATGRYAFTTTGIYGSLSYAKLDTRTGEAWACSAGLDACLPMTNKAAFLASQSEPPPGSQTEKH
jgi:hypothetical protein